VRDDEGNREGGKIGELDPDTSTTAEMCFLGQEAEQLP